MSATTTGAGAVTLELGSVKPEPVSRAASGANSCRMAVLTLSALLSLILSAAALGLALDIRERVIANPSVLLSRRGVSSP